MAIVFQTLSTIGTGVRVGLSDPTNTYTEIAGIAVISTDAADAIQSTVNGGNENLLISGQVIGGNAINIAGTNPTFFLSNSAQGLIEGVTGFGVTTTGSATVVNNGEITGVGGGVKLAIGEVQNYATILGQGTSNSSGVTITGGGVTINNFGTISGHFGSVNYDVNAQGGTVLNNYGTLNGRLLDQSAAFTVPQFLNSDRILNAGTINGDVYIVGNKNSVPQHRLYLDLIGLNPAGPVRLSACGWATSTPQWHLTR